MTLAMASIARSHSDIEALEQIAQESCSLAIWERDAIPDFSDLALGEPRNIRLHASLSQLPGMLQARLIEYGFARPDLHPALIQDAAMLANKFCAVLGLAAVELRLELVTTDSCRKFHADYVTARLITTYVGSGTNWIEADDADRVRNGLAPREIHAMSTGDVGIFKGKLGYGDPAVHRSPPINGTGERRLLLVLNPPES